MTNTRIFAIASGKGGVGKTSFTLNLAAQLVKHKKRVLIFDGDFGLANLDVQLGIHTQKDLSHVLAGQATLADILVATDYGFDILPGRSGATNMAFMTAMEQFDLLTHLKNLAADYDICLIDVPAGLDQTVLTLCAAAKQTLVLATPDPSSITDAYALMKLLHQKQNIVAMQLIINQAHSLKESSQTATKLITAANKFLNLHIPLMGHVLYERTYAEAIKTQDIATVTQPKSKAATSFDKLAQSLLLL